MTRFVLIANPEHRRATMFQDELAAAGLPPAEIVSYADLIADPEALAKIDDEPAIVRQDSHGQDFDVERGLLRLGVEDARALGATVIEPDEIDALEYERGRIVAPRQLHCGFLRVLDAIARTVAKRPQWRVLQAPMGIADLFDKRVTSRRWASHGQPVPDPLDVEDWREIQGPAFAKLSCGSSASCVARLLVAGRRVMVHTTVEMQGGRMYNSRRLQRYQDPEVVDRLWAFLRREGMHVERALPKAKIDGEGFDLRIVVLDGAPEFVIVRRSRAPMTNLHLGGRRGDWDALRPTIPAGTWDAISDSCRAVAGDVGCFTVGLDVLLDPSLEQHAIIEGNAFGDLFPGLVQSGSTVYARQIARLRGTC